MATVVVKRVKVILSVLRSILNPVSLFELSVQTKSIRELDAVVAVKPVGAVGASGSVVSDAVLVYEESPPALVAATR